MHHQDHPAPVFGIPLRTLRPVFILGALAFVVAGAWLSWIAIDALRTSTTGIMVWFILVLGLITIMLFGGALLVTAKQRLGSYRGIGLVLSQAGLTDRTQLVSPLPIIHWRLVESYDIVAVQNQTYLALRISDPTAYEHQIRSRMTRWTFRFNTKIFGYPVHAIALYQLGSTPEELRHTLQLCTRARPGQRIG